MQRREQKKIPGSTGSTQDTRTSPRPPPQSYPEVRPEQRQSAWHSHKQRGRGKGVSVASNERKVKEWKELHQSKSHTPKYITVKGKSCIKAKVTRPSLSYGVVPNRICKATRKYDPSRRKVLGIRTSPGHKGRKVPGSGLGAEKGTSSPPSLQQRWG